MDLNITKDEMMKVVKRKLWYGEYEATDKFRSIEKHASVCFEDGTLVAVTGKAGDRESQVYAALFADAPAMLLEIAKLRAALKFYADDTNYEPQYESVPYGSTSASMPVESKIENDCGEVAREALKITGS